MRVKVSELEKKKLLALSFEYTLDTIIMFNYTKIQWLVIGKCNVRRFELLNWHQILRKKIVAKALCTRI